MCAIIGILNRGNRPASKQLMARMTGALAHRGPDGDGLMLRGPVAFGHRRLSIIDPTGGRQPMTNEDGQVWVTFNGEIYNYRELAAELKGRGHVFRTQSDTEVIVHAWEQWGEDCVKRFRGMFAFGIMDWRADRLFLARDHFGIKPLYFIQTQEAIAFASELQALRLVPGFKGDLDVTALDQYLWLQYIPAPRSIYRQIQKLPPAHCMSVDLAGRISGPREYWRVAFQPDERRTEAEWVEAVDAAVTDSVKAHLVSDVPFGAFLSGGVDSSLVVANMSRLLDQPVQTFSIGFEEKDFDETQHARFAAAHCGAKPHVEIVKADALGILSNLVRHYGEPFGDSSAVPTFYVSQLARQHVSMVLSGDGADEMFAGYWSHGDWMAAWADKAGATPHLPDWLKFIQYTDTPRRLSLWRPEFRSHCPAPLEVFAQEWERTKGFSTANKAQYLDLKTYLPYDILTKVDIASMMHGLEVRTPLVDLRVVELAATIPDRFNLARGQNGQWERKRLLKRVAAKYFPAEFLNRPKMGFAMPLVKWFSPGGKAHASVTQRLLGHDSTLRDYFEPAAIQQLMAQSAFGPVWLLTFLEEWLRQNKPVADCGFQVADLQQAPPQKNAGVETKPKEAVWSAALDACRAAGATAPTAPVATAPKAAPARPRVLLIADVPNWIFERHARMLNAYLHDEFDFTLGFQGEDFNEANFDLIYPLEFNLVDAARIREPGKYITGIRSHLSWQPLDFPSLAQSLARNFRSVHVVSRRLESIFKPALPAVELLSHGVDTAFFTPTTSAGQSGAKLRLGWAGNRLSASRKGFKEIIEPLGKLPGVELVFCGYNDGNLSLEQMRDFYNSLDAYVCASDFEGNNNSLMEAAAMQRSIITTDNGAVPEYLRHGENALIVERALPAFIQAVEQLRDDPALRERLGAAARESVKQNFDWNDMAARYRDFFWKALKNRSHCGSPIQPGHNAAPLVSVVIPCYNQAVYLPEAVASVVGQTFSDWEIIIVNDGSSDNTSEVARDLISRYSGRQIRLVEQANRGLAGARNSGIRAARGRYVLPLDGDDKLHAQFLETTAGILNTDASVAIAYTDWRTFGETNGEIAAGDYDFQALCVWRNLFTCSALFRREAWDAAGGYNENMRKGYEDWNFWISCGERGFKARRIPQALFFYRTRANSMVADAANHDRQLRARIVLNHPALYTKASLDQARQVLGEAVEPSSNIAAGPQGRFFMTYLSDELPVKSVFDEAYYLKHNPDVAEEIKYRGLASGWHHFTQKGCTDRRLWAPLPPTTESFGTNRSAKPPVVSIVIPVFNKLELTKQCLRSIANNTEGIEYEIIVVDNGSTDGTAAWLRQVAQETGSCVRAEINGKNLGFARASNQGAKAGRGKYILFLNNDTEVLPGWLAPLVQILDRDASVAAVGSKLLFPDKTIQHAGVVISMQRATGLIGPFHIYYREPANLPAANRAMEYEVCTGACLLTRAEQIATLGGFDENFWNGYEDVDLCFQFRQRGWRVVYEPQSVVIHYESQSGAERFSKEQSNIDLLQKKWHNKIQPDVLIAPDGKATLQTRTRIKPYTIPGTTHRKAQPESAPAQPVAPSAPVPRPAATAPRASVIIPTFNNLALTRQCLLALEKNTAAGQYEIVIVDNASTDGTVEFLKGEEKSGRLRVILNRENAGFAKACNQGAMAAKTDLLLFLNNDTQVTPGWLNALAQAVGRPETGIVGAKLLYADGRIQHAGIGFIGNLPDHPHRHAAADAPEVNQFRELDMVTGACLMIRRELFLQLAGFDETYRNGVEDIDLCLRARAAGWKVVYEPKAVVFHLEGQSVGRFNHVTDNLKIFFGRWGKSFDSQKQFVAPNPVKTIPSQRSVLLTSETSNSAKPLTVAWEGTFLDFGSLSYVNRQLSQCLTAQPGIQLSRVGNRNLPGSASAEMQELARTLKPTSGKETQVTIRHQWPPDWSRPKHGALVVIQPWEYGALPQDWVTAAANVDEFWVPSQYVRQVYIDSGIAAGKVFVVPNGVDAERYREGAKPLALATKKKFRFLFVGGTIHRKGPDLLLEAYLKTFTSADDVCLVIKDFGGKSVYAGQTFEKQIQAAQARPDAPEILYLTDELAADAMPGLYAACHCLAHPYRGEGFGLPVLEAMACGLPVIVTGGGATDDFAGEEYVYRIAAQRKNIGSEISGMKLARNGWLFEPDLPALAAQMKWVAGHRDEARNKGRAAGEQVRKEWTWQRAAQTAWHRLQALRAVAPAPRMAAKPVVVALPETAKIGHLGGARDLLARKEFVAAWQSTLEALGRRPFHPEAWVLLAEIARTAGDMERARFCAKRAREMAPNWRPAKQFAKSLPARSGQSRTWPGLPENPTALRLTVCLIVKNEEQFLGRCLESVRELAHQIVVVDTGSTDRTIEIAKKFNAEVHEFAWTDDFSAARNEALKHATGDWVLSLDADEELLPEHRQTILREIQVAGVMGYRLPIINEGREKEGCSYVPRLFRNAPGLFYLGRVHEQVFSSIEVRCKEWGLQHLLGKSVILHHGYVQQVVASRGKIERNLRLLQRAIEELPGEPNLVMNLGLELIRSGQFAAGLEKYREALDLMTALPSGQVVPELRETLLTQLTTHLLAAKEFAGVAKLWESPFAKSGGLTASNHFGLGLAYMELKRPAEAAEQMRQCLAKRARPVLSPVNTDILNAGPNHCLALCLAALKEKDAAAQAFAAAIAEDSSSRSIRFDFARFQAENGQPLEALRHLNDLAAENPGEAPVWLWGGQIALSRGEFLEFARDWTGEAMKHFPDHPGILLQRAEVLLLTQDMAGALPLWQRAHSSNSSRQVAAVVLCEFLTGGCCRHFPPSEEAQVSRELLKWYRQLIAAGANSSINQLHERMDEVRDVAPGFVAVWESATKQAREKTRETLVPA